MCLSYFLLLVPTKYQINVREGKVYFLQLLEVLVHTQLQGSMAWRSSPSWPANHKRASKRERHSFFSPTFILAPSPGGWNIHTTNPSTRQGTDHKH